MCSDCYKEFGSPKIITDKTIHAAELVNQLYDCKGCSVGGYGHIVFDDWNLEDNNILFCLRNAEHISDDGRLKSIEALKLFKSLSIEERYSAMAISNGIL